MNTFKQFLFFLLLTPICVIISQNTVGIQINTADSFQGYTLFSPRTSEIPRFTYLMDNCGSVINTWESEFPLFSTDYLLPNGSLFRSVVDNQSTLNIPGNTGRLENFSWEGDLIWASTISEIDFSFHHDYVLLDNGNILLLVAFRKTLQEALDNGRDPATIETNELYEERVWEIEPQGSDSYTIVWEWRSWDHLIQDFDNTKENFGDVASNPQKVDFNFGTSFGEADWWHSNAISYHKERDQILISNRNLDEFIIIDHSTSTEEASTNSGGNSDRGGDILYRYGNSASYRQDTTEDQDLNAMHDVQFIDESSPNSGKILIFNNQPDKGFSEIRIIDPDFDSDTQNYIYEGGAYGPDEAIFSYTDPENFFAPFLSGVQELPNGNFLITSGPDGRLFEITATGDRVWDYISPVGNSGILQDGDDPSSSQTRVFRSLKYPLDYEAFENRELIAGDPIELNPSTDGCQLLSIQEITNNEEIVSLYPNPASEKVTIITKKELLKIQIYDLSGKMITSSTQKIIDISTFKPGLFLTILTYTDGKTLTVKFLKN